MKPMAFFTPALVKKPKQGPGQMAPWIRALVALLEDPGSVPTTHMRASNQRRLPYQDAGVRHTHAQAEHSHR